jgi:hypothetical protein
MLRVEKKLEFDEKLNKYYELKAKYENSISHKKQQIKKSAKVNGLSKKDTRDMFRKFTPDCVSCSRKVGSIFEKKKIDTSFHLLAKCGSKLEPCKLNIDLNMGDIMYTLKEKRKEEESIDKYVKDIIITKNDELFGFIKEEDAIKKFEELNNELNSAAGYYAEILEAYLSVTNNKENEEELKSLSQLLNTQIISIKKNMEDFVKTNRKQYIKDAIELYVTDMASTIHSINNLKYREMRLDFSPVTKEYILIQKKFTEEDFMLYDNYEVVSYEIGKQDDSAKNKRNDKQSALSDNIIDMSARDVNNESDVEEELSTSNKIITETKKADTSESEPYVPASTPVSQGEDDEEDEDENEREDEETDELPDNVSDVSSDTSSIEDKPLLVLGENIDSTSDSFIPPPPPLEESSKQSEDSEQYVIGTPDIEPRTPPYAPSEAPIYEPVSFESNSDVRK